MLTNRGVRLIRGRLGGYFLLFSDMKAARIQWIAGLQSGTARIRRHIRWPHRDQNRNGPECGPVSGLGRGTAANLPLMRRGRIFMPVSRRWSHNSSLVERDGATG